MAQEEFALLLRETSFGSVCCGVFGGDVADVVVCCVTVGDYETAYAGLRYHRAGVGEGDAGAGKEREDVTFEAVIRAAGVAYAGTDEPEAFRNQGLPSAAEVFRGRLCEGHAQGVADEVVIAGSVYSDGEKTELRRSFLREEIRQAMGVAEHRKDKASVGRNYVVTDASAIEETGLNVRRRPLFRDDG